MNDAAYQEHYSEAKQGIKSDSLDGHKRFVFVINHAVYRKDADAFAGWEREVVSSFDTWNEAGAVWVRHCLETSDEILPFERPDIIDQQPVAIPDDDDECDFPI